LVQQAWGRVQMARGIERPHFTVNAHEAIDAGVTLGELLGLCLAENERRSSAYDARLLRPRVIPTLARAARWVVALGEGATRELREARESRPSVAPRGILARAL